ncbi:hypothetical protein D1872_346190 [compost metagenome]
MQVQMTDNRPRLSLRKSGVFRTSPRRLLQARRTRGFRVHPVQAPKQRLNELLRRVLLTLPFQQ